MMMVQIANICGEGADCLYLGVEGEVHSFTEEEHGEFLRYCRD